MQPIRGGAIKAPAAAIGRLQFEDIEQIGLLVQTLTEDLLDRPILGRTEAQCARTGGFKSTAAVCVAQTHHRRSRPQVDEDAVAKQALDERQAGGADALGLCQTAYFGPS